MKICFVTATRAEYGLMKYLMKEISAVKDFTLQLIVTGTHLSEQHGMTLDEIKLDDFNIDSLIDMGIGDDSNYSTCLSLSQLIPKLSKVFHKILPDLVCIVGDRYELLGIVSAATIHRIPIAHIHGGETTEGAFDEGIRHAITKMSHLHFVANDVYKKRVIQLGENPNLVYNVGGLGVDAIKKIKLLSKEKLEQDLGIKFMRKNFLITYHPPTLSSKYQAQKEISELIKALSSFKETLQIFTMPNADPGNKFITDIITKYIRNNKNAFYFKSLGQVRYFSCLSNVDALIGNSSSGLLEAPSFNIATINIGNRQKGRLTSESILNVPASSDLILNRINHIYTKGFKKVLTASKNPYGNGGASSKITSILQKVEVKSLLKKSFFDINFSYD